MKSTGTYIRKEANKLEEKQKIEEKEGEEKEER